MNKKETIEISKRIDAYIRGNLSKREIDELWLQFLKNPYFYELFETELHLRNLIQKNRHSRGLITKRRKRTASIKLWVMAAAATIIVILTIKVYFIDSTLDFDSLALSSIPYNEMAAGNVERSEDEFTISVETDMNRAMAVAYLFKEYEALEMYRELKSSAVNESQKIRIEFNMAILYYNRSEYKVARESFISVTDSKVIDKIYLERAWWFLANTYLKLNDQEKAKEAALTVKFLDGNNSESASTLLKALNKRGS